MIIFYMVIETLTYKEDHDIFFNSLSWMFTFSVLFSIPAGSVYSGVINKILSSKNQEVVQSEKEPALNWVLIMMDAGSLLAAAFTAFIFI